MMPPAATPGGVIHSIGMSTAILIAARMAPVISQIFPARGGERGLVGNVRRI